MNAGIVSPATLRIGTRGSQLALWQARTVAAQLEAAHAGLTCEIVIIKTSGDKLAEAPLSEAGGKRLFVREIEEALIDRRVDLAVHSAKDMPVATVGGLTIAAVLAREEPWDAIVLPAMLASEGLAGEGLAAEGTSRSDDADADAQRLLQRLALANGLVVGTSSVRRVAQLRRLLPAAEFAPIRGNLDTRLRKLDEGQYDVLVLAAAGLKRLGAGDRISARLPLEACLPAPGQGAIAVQVRADDEATRERVVAIDDPRTATALIAEQAVVEALGGGCQTPIGALALPTAGPPPHQPRLELHAIVIALDGTRAIRATAAGPAHEAGEIGRRAAQELLAQGAAEILSESASGA